MFRSALAMGAVETVEQAIAKMRDAGQRLAPLGNEIVELAGRAATGLVVNSTRLGFFARMRIIN